MLAGMATHSVLNLSASKFLLEYRVHLTYTRYVERATVNIDYLLQQLSVCGMYCCTEAIIWRSVAVIFWAFAA